MGLVPRLYASDRSRFRPRLIQIPPRRESVRDIVTGADPVLASTRLGRILFWLVAFTMLYILLVFAFWGLFIY